MTITKNRRAESLDLATSCPSVFAIVVIYLSDEEKIHSLLHTLVIQCHGVVVVLNSSISDELRSVLAGNPNVYVREALDNVGLASAQNSGIDIVRQLGGEWIVFFDQDSSPTADHVAGLLAANRLLASQGKVVGSIGPRLIDVHTGRPWPFYKAGWFRMTEISDVPENGFVEVDYLWSSGSLISVATLAKVGLFDAAMFIDLVDVEWGYRASDRGFTNFGCNSVAMNHSLGEGCTWFLGRRHPKYSATRNYYYFRNSIYLLWLAHIPFLWKLNELLRVTPRLLLYSMISDAPLKHLRLSLLGVWHGLVRKTGKLDEAYSF